jgi:hypothetical protein
MILINNCNGLARQNESGFESVHKVGWCLSQSQNSMYAQGERFAREHGARKTNIEENVTDIFTHQSTASDPVVRTFDKKVSSAEQPKEAESSAEQSKETQCSAEQSRETQCSVAHSRAEQMEHFFNVINIVAALVQSLLER